MRGYHAVHRIPMATHCSQPVHHCRRDTESVHTPVSVSNLASRQIIQAILVALCACVNLSNVKHLAKCCLQWILFHIFSTKLYFRKYHGCKILRRFFQRAPWRHCLLHLLTIFSPLCTKSCTALLPLLISSLQMLLTYNILDNYQILQHIVLCAWLCLIVAQASCAGLCLTVSKYSDWS